MIASQKDTDDVGAAADNIKNEAGKWRGKIRNMMPCPWWIPNKVCDVTAEVGGWACAPSGVCEIVDDCLGGNRLKCAEHVGEALAEVVMGLLSGGAAAVGKFMLKRRPAATSRDSAV